MVFTDFGTTFDIFDAPYPTVCQFIKTLAAVCRCNNNTLPVTA